MNHHPLRKSVQMIGGIVDTAITQETLSLEGMAAVETLIEYTKADLNAAKISNYTAFLTGIPSGFAVSKMFDTNDNPSDLRTFMVMAGGAIANFGLQRLILSMTGADLEVGIKARNEANEIVAALQTETSAALQKLYELNAISEAEQVAALASLNEDVAALRTAANVKYAIGVLTGLASGYHGYRRNGDSILYGLAWMIANNIGLGVALGQGYAKPLNK